MKQDRKLTNQGRLCFVNCNVTIKLEINILLHNENKDTITVMNVLCFLQLYIIFKLDPYFFFGHLMYLHCKIGIMLLFSSVTGSAFLTSASTKIAC